MCIIEVRFTGLEQHLNIYPQRDHLGNGTDATWFNVFTIIFELVSAYGTVGLSLGVSYDNYSWVVVCGRR